MYSVVYLNTMQFLSIWPNTVFTHVSSFYVSTVYGVNSFFPTSVVNRYSRNFSTWRGGMYGLYGAVLAKTGRTCYLQKIT